MSMRGGNGVARTGQKCDVAPRRDAVRDDDLPGQRAEQPRGSRSDRGRAEGCRARVADPPHDDSGFFPVRDLPAVEFHAAAR